MNDELRPEPLGDRAKAAVALLSLVIVAALVSLWADAQQLDLLNRAVDGERITLTEAQESDDRVASTALLYLVAVILSAITFLLWYARAYRNVRALGVSEPRWGRRWAIAYWFIPIVNLFRPKQVMNDVWRGSDPELDARTDRVEHLPVHPLLHWWWAAWLISGWVGNFAVRRLFTGDDSLESVRSQAQAYVASDVADVIAALLAIFVVRRITARQEERRRRFEEGSLPGRLEPSPPSTGPVSPPSATG